MQALKSLLGEKFANKSPEETMKAYAPPSENDTDAYIKFLTRQGVDPGVKVGDQVDKMAAAIKKFEGWDANKKTRVEKHETQSLIIKFFKSLFE